MPKVPSPYEVKYLPPVLKSSINLGWKSANPKLAKSLQSFSLRKIKRYISSQFLLKMFLKPVWVGKIHGVEVYATHVVRIWWFSNKFSIFQLKRM